MNESGGRSQTIILQLNGREFARAVYKANNEETQRVGLKLASARAKKPPTPCSMPYCAERCDVASGKHIFTKRKERAMEKFNFDTYFFIVAYFPLTSHLMTVYRNKNSKLLDPELKKLAISTFLLSILLSLSLIYLLSDIVVNNA